MRRFDPSVREWVSFWTLLAVVLFCLAACVVAVEVT